MTLDQKLTLGLFGLKSDIHALSKEIGKNQSTS